MVAFAGKKHFIGVYNAMTSPKIKTVEIGRQNLLPKVGLMLDYNSAKAPTVQLGTVLIFQRQCGRIGPFRHQPKFGSFPVPLVHLLSQRKTGKNHSMRLQLFSKEFLGQGIQLLCVLSSRKYKQTDVDQVC